MIGRADFDFIKIKIYRKIFSEWIQTLDGLRSENGAINKVSEMIMIKEITKAFRKTLRTVGKMDRKIRKYTKPLSKDGKFDEEAAMKEFMQQNNLMHLF